MKLYFNFISAIIFLMFQTNLLAQTNFLEVNKLDNSVYRVEINDLNKITFSGTNMNIRLKNGETTTIGTTAVRSMVFRTSTAVSGVNLKNNINVFPNPASEYICINHNFVQEQEAIIFTLTGQQVLQQRIQNSSDRIQIGQLNPGIYVLQVDNQFVKFTKR